MVNFLKYSTAIGLISLTTVAAAQFAKPADAVKYRQSAFNVISIHTQRLGAMMKGETPFDRTAIETNAVVIEMLSKQLVHTFPVGSDIPPSKAKPAVWQDAVDFKLKMDEFQSAAIRLNTASRSGDINTVKPLFNSLAQTCKSCHESYRNR